MQENYIIYAVVFAAVFLPVAIWRREAYVSADMPIGDWNRLPAVFKFFIRPAYLLETSIGRTLAMILPGVAKRYQAEIEISGLPITPERLFVCQLLLSLMLCALGSFTFFVGSVSTLTAEGVTIGALVLGWMIPSMTLSSYAKNRQEEIVRSLPFAIDLMGSAMRAGLEFGAAMRYYANLGNGGALEEEFTRVLRDATLGKPLAESLQDMANRVRIKTFTAFAGVIAYGTEIGASIADTLKVHGAEMRRERFSLAEQKAARAPSVMIFPLAVFIMPAVFLIIFVPVLMQFIATKGA